MSRIARMMSSLLLPALLLPAACSDSTMPAPFQPKDRTVKADHDAPFDPPKTYPEWAYDSNTYVRPAEDLKPESKAKPDDPQHYFTREKVVMIRRPEGYRPEEAPRIAIWWTDNNGFHWNRAGYFGREQSFFPFEVAEDGDYGIRFVGPGQESASHALPYPVRVYHVDTAKPMVQVAINPEQTWYHVGDKLTVAWRAEDYHLIDRPVSVGMLMDFTDDEHKMKSIQRELPSEGSLIFALPPETLDHEVRFRVDAIDRANNLGIAISFALQVVPESQDSGDSKPADSTTSEDQSARAAVREELPLQPETAALSASVIDLRESPPVEARAATPSAKADDAQDLSTENWIEKHPSKDGDSSRASPPLGDQPPSSPQAEVAPTGPVDSTPATLPPSLHNADDAAPFADAGGPPLESDAKAVDEPDCNTPPASGGLAIPFPATVDAPTRSLRWASGHPWRSLGDAVTAAVQTVWSLPRTGFSQDLDPIPSKRFLADNPALRPAGEPGRPDSTFVGTPVTDGDVEPPIVP